MRRYRINHNEKFTDKLRGWTRTARDHITRKRLAVAGAITIFAVVAIPVATYAAHARDISDRDRLMNRNSTGVILRDKNGQPFYESGKLSTGDDVPLSKISDDFEKSLIASEDQDFYKHNGYSIKGIAAAMYANLANKNATKYGGSTITQQLVKNKLLTSDKSYFRKYQELSMSVAVERRYSKDEILEMYINSVYFGQGAFGISDASKAYFNKSPQDLNLAESSMLIGILPAPTAYSPITGDKEKAKEQQEAVLSRMVKAGKITEDQKEQTLGQEISYNPATITEQEYGQHFATMVLEELKKKYGEENVIRGGFDVTTTLDSDWQKKAEEAAKERVAALEKAGARNAGLVAIDPKTGQVKSLVGSVDWKNPTFGKVNMATSLRQPGSSFKPIYYTEALDKKKVTLSTIMEDKKKTWDTYAPTNYDFKYRGNIPVRNALAQSLNIPSVDVMQKVGVQDAVDTAERMGISDVNDPNKYGLSLALGTAEVKLYDMVNAYAAFANAGEQYTPTTFTAIKNKYNDEIFKYKQPKAKRVQSAEASYLISNALSDNKARAPTFGTALNINDRKVAVKTGTTNDSKDTWTIGYTPSIAVGVWMGNNENEAMKGLAGSSSAGGVWKSTISKYLESTPKEEFKKPSGVVETNVCNNTSVTSGRYEEFFIKGTEPSQSCNQETKKDNSGSSTPQPTQRNEEEQRDNNQEQQRRRTNNNSETNQQNNTNTPPNTDGNGTGGNGNPRNGGGRGGGTTPTPTTPTQPAN